MMHLLQIQFMLFGITVAYSQIPNRTESQILFNNNIDNDYYYEYELSSNNITSKFNHDSEILPNPESFESKFVDTVDVLPEINIPDNSLADTDLHDHDFIDNIMYIYYGAHTKNGYTFGAEIILIGSVLSFAAQFLTIICTLLRKHAKNDIYKLYLNIIFCLCITNLIFMLGVYATKYRDRCKFVAVLLHYMHLVVSVWIFTHSYVILKRFSNEYVPNLKIIMVLSYGVPAFLVLLFYGISPSSYESKKFCWMSVQKGMFLNFMLPVTALIIITTLISLNGIRKINMELSKYELSSTDSIITTVDFVENKSKIIEKHVATYVDIQLNDNDLNTNDNNNYNIIKIDNIDPHYQHDIDGNDNSYLQCLHSCKTCLKVLAIIQTTYICVWFIAVLALENAVYSSVMPLIYAICSIILNWFIFAKSKYLIPNLKDIIYNMNSQTNLNSTDLHKSMDDSNLSHCGDTSDNVPLLLNNSENYTELIELRTESISTISS